MAYGADLDPHSLPPGGSITDVPGLKVGHHTLTERPTGCTVLICEAGATAGQYTAPEDFQSLILEIGRIPAERNTTYSRIKIKLPVESMTSEQALVPEFA